MNGGSGGMNGGGNSSDGDSSPNMHSPSLSAHNSNASTPALKRNSTADKIRSFFPIRFSLRTHGVWAELLETLHADLTELIHTFDENWNLKVADNIARCIARAFRQPAVHADTLCISFFDMRLGDQIIDAFLQVLVGHETFGRVGSVCVRNNALTGLCVPAISHVLQFSTYLHTLDLSCNAVGDDGIAHLAKGLRGNIILHTLNLAYTAAADAAAQELAEVLLANKTLRALDLTGNPLQRDAVGRLLDAATANTTLLAFTLYATPGLDRIALARLEEILTRNARASSSHTSPPHASPHRGPHPFEWSCHEKNAALTLCCSSFRDAPDLFTVLTNATITTLPPEVNAPIPQLERRPSVFVQKEAPRSLDLLLATPETVSFMNSLPFNKTWKREGRFMIGCSDTIGRRASMEDVMVICENFQNKKGNYIMALFDGHGGPDAANFAAEQIVQTMAYMYDTDTNNSDHPTILRKTFNELSESMQGYLFCGTTAATVSILGDRLYSACAGDSRIVMSRGGEPIRLSRDHKPTLPDERKRITDEGGFIKDGRVNGVLSGWCGEFFFLYHESR
eukprot:TRINITY_DN2734_c0_g1_i2.p1 TRINITY_DN2734_c0_g1~~TRINITY_DN2734_c0_g1_i2.p1  ORF type:complete len:657 (+),score=99.60 TRINITY_DN2734_c0_g1_i2:276-1973(+)